MEKATIEEWQQRHQALIALWRDYEAILVAASMAHAALNDAIDESQKLLDASRPRSRSEGGPAFQIDDLTG